MKIASFIAPTTGRLDKILQDLIKDDVRFDGVTRSQIKNSIEKGKVSVDGGSVLKAGAEVRAAQHIAIEIPETSESTLASYDIPLTIVYEDEELLVVDKPAGLSMHPGAGNSSTTLVNALLHYFRREGKKIPESMRENADLKAPVAQRPGIVHRLDKDTTGLVVVAKTLRAHAALSEQFALRTVGRRYVALAFITPRGKRPFNLSDSGKIDAALSRHATRRKEMAIAANGRRAVTHWKIIERLGYGALVELKLETGRTHQIRIHLAHSGSPVIGDRTYGDFSGLPAALKREQDRFGRQALHAGLLEFDHPKTAQRLSFSSALPQDFTDLIEIFRKSNE